MEMTEAERKTIYHALCEKKKINNLFLQPWWLDATGHWDIAFAYRNDQVVGAMPFAIRRKWGVKYLGMPALTHHMNIWMDKPPDVSDHKWLTREKQIIWSLVDNLPKHGFFSMVFSENSFNNWLPFHWKGFRQEMRYTFVIDRIEDMAWEDQMISNYKKIVRKASSEFQIKREVDPESFYKVCSQTYKRQGKSIPYSFEKFVSIDTAVQQHHAGAKFGAFTPEGKLVAVFAILFDDQKAYGFVSGDEDEGRAGGASILLCNEAIRMSFEERKVKTFDFCGSMLEPISEVRKQFGAQAAPLMKIFKANHKWLDILYKLTR